MEALTRAKWSLDALSILPKGHVHMKTVLVKVKFRPSLKARFKNHQNLCNRLRRATIQSTTGAYEIILWGANREHLSRDDTERLKILPKSFSLLSVETEPCKRFQSFMINNYISVFPAANNKVRKRCYASIDCFSYQAFMVERRTVCKRLFAPL